MHDVLCPVSDRTQALLPATVCEFCRVIAATRQDTLRRSRRAPARTHTRSHDPALIGSPEYLAALGVGHADAADNRP